MTETYNPLLVVLSVMVAIVASYTALDMAGRVAASRGRSRLAWLLGGSFAMGTGIWSMHFVGMLALSLPVAIYYDVPTVVLSALVAVAASFLALHIAGRATMGLGALLGGGLSMGVAIAGMHYIGMVAMRMEAGARYDAGLVVLSIAIAIGASVAALWLAHRFRHGETAEELWGMAASAVTMGMAISGMHYTGMWAADFVPGAGDLAAGGTLVLATSGLLAAVTLTTLAILGVALSVASMDRRVRSRVLEATRESERLAREQRAFLRQVIDTDPSLLFVKDWDGRFTLANKAVAAVYETTPEDLVGRTDADFNEDAEEVRHFRDEDRKVIETGQKRVIPEESVTNPRTGETRWFSTVKVPLEGGEGERPQVLGVAMDITERKRAEEALRRSEAEYRGLVENATYGIFRADREGRFLSANPALVSMLGYGSAEELMEIDPATDVFADADEHDRLMRRMEEHHQVEDVELGWKRVDGEPIRVRISGHAVEGDTGDPGGFEVIVEDVTQQRSTEDQLRQAQKMKAMGQLTGGIAHEFNNVLSVVLGNAQLGLSHLPPGEERLGETLHEIERAALAGARMVRQLLSFSRRADLDMEPTDLGSVVARASSMLRRVIPEHVAIEVDADDGVSTVMADVASVEQILLNLATNARDAMPDGGRLRIAVGIAEVDDRYSVSHPWAEPGRYVVISVSDDGVGMDEATRARIFEPFFTTKPRGAGTGLGVAMVYGLMEQHGGIVDVASEPGEGTTVDLYFPVSAEVAEPGDRRPDEGAASDASGERGGSETILLVEDEDAVRRTGKRVLEEHGYRVLVAVDGVEAIELHRANASEIELVISDSIMPRMNGIELYEALRSTESPPKFLMVSGYREQEAQGRLASDHSLPFLQKPWTIEELLARVRAVLDEDEREA